MTVTLIAFHIAFLETKNCSFQQNPGCQPVLASKVLLNRMIWQYLTYKFHLNRKAGSPVVAGGPARRGLLRILPDGAVEEGLAADGLHGVGDVVVEELAPLHRHVRHRGIRAHLQ